MVIRIRKELLIRYAWIKKISDNVSNVRIEDVNKETGERNQIADCIFANDWLYTFMLINKVDKCYRER